jgi:hypothetical protein
VATRIVDMSKDYRNRAADISASALRVYEYWIGKNLTPQQAYEMAKAAYNDNAEYEKQKRAVK